MVEHLESPAEVDTELQRHGLGAEQRAVWWGGPLAQPGSLSRTAAWRDNPDLRGEVLRQAEQVDAPGGRSERRHS